MKSLKVLIIVARAVVIGLLLTGLHTAVMAESAGRSDTAEVQSGHAATLPDSAPDGLDRGEKIRVQVEKWQDRVRHKIEALDKIFQGFDLRKIEVQQFSRERFEEILDDLEEESEEILRGFADVQPDVKLLRQTLLKAPDIFRQIAAEFEEKASKSDDEFFRESYADLAAASKKMAANCEQKAKAMDALERELQSKLKFVQTSQEFCQHIRRFLRTLPAEPGITTEKWIERVNAYVSALEQAVKLLKTMTQGMDQKPTADPQAKPLPAAAATSPAAPPRPMTLVEAKARLVSFKK
jgi:hypothetical protein